MILITTSKHLLMNYIRKDVISVLIVKVIINLLDGACHFHVLISFIRFCATAIVVYEICLIIFIVTSI